MFKGIDHVEIVPGNFERTLKFYTEILGARIQRRRKSERPPAQELVFLELGNMLIEMFSVKGPAPMSTEPYRVGYRRIALQVEDMDKAIEYLKSKKVTISRDPVTVEDLHLRVAGIEDPDGLSIELVQRG